MRGLDYVTPGKNLVVPPAAVVSSHRAGNIGSDHQYLAQTTQLQAPIKDLKGKEDQFFTPC